MHFSEGVHETIQSDSATFILSLVIYDNTPKVYKSAWPINLF